MSELKINIFITGVGGQGVGLLSETILRAYDYAGLPVKGVDTHGLAQRGGSVTSHIRIGKKTGSPLIEPGKADILLALERTEAYRNLPVILKQRGTLVYYDTVWQSLAERLGASSPITSEMIEKVAKERNIEVHRVSEKNLKDPRMQNTALLAYALRHSLFPQLSAQHIKSAMEDLLSPIVIEENIRVLEGMTLPGASL